MKFFSFQNTIVLSTLFFLIPLTTQAQERQNEFRINIFRSKITGGTASSFFNTTVFGIEYQHKLINNLNLMAGTRFVQFIADRNTFKKAGEETSKSFISFDTGLSLIPVIIGNFEIRFNLGPSLRHRNEVLTVIAIKIEDFGTVVANDYQSRWDIGGFFNLEFAYYFNDKWLLGLRGQFHTYDKGDAVFDVGISIGRKF